jgi:hypothetical protein
VPNIKTEVNDVAGGYFGSGRAEVQVIPSVGFEAPDPVSIHIPFMAESWLGHMVIEAAVGITQRVLYAKQYIKEMSIVAREI